MAYFLLESGTHEFPEEVQKWMHCNPQLAATFAAQLAATLLGVSIALVGGIIVYGGLKVFFGIRLNAEEQYMSADLAIHKISSTPTAAARDD